VLVIFGLKIKELLDREIIIVKYDDDQGYEGIGQPVLKVSP
jgi:hypothetical protein